MGSRRMSPRQIARLMKKMGIEQKEVTGVEEVIFRFKDREWVVTRPQVMLIRQAGVESYQVTGEKRERAIRGEPEEREEKQTPGMEIPVEDAALVAQQTGASIEEAMQALRETEGDLAAAILKLKHR